MLKPAEREVQEIRTLLLNPTVENFALVNQKLELLASYLTSVKNTLSSGQACDSTSRKFLTRLPNEMAKMRALLEGPIQFFRGINALRASRFGSYGHSGTLRSFDLEVRGKTLIHL